MRQKNLTSMPFGAVVTSRRPPKPEMVAIVRGTFRIVPGGVASLAGDFLEQGPLTAEVFRDDEQEKTGAPGECIYPGDFAHFKPKADVLLVGTCRHPGGPGAKEQSVTFGVGEWTKSLRVTVPDGVEERRVLGFGPVSPEAAERKARWGKNWGAEYARTRAPYFADDFDWRYFNAAPADQQIGYFAGDEEITIKNIGALAAEHPVVRTRLPALRVRVFVRDVGGTTREVPMVCDTLFCDADEGTIVLVWRGLVEVGEDDLADVKTALIASEPLASPPEPAARYATMLDEHDADPTGMHAALPDELKDLPDQGVEHQLVQKAVERAVANAPPGTDVRAKIAEAMARTKKPAGGNGHAGAGAVPPDLRRKVAEGAGRLAAQARAAGVTEGVAALDALAAAGAAEGKDEPGPNADLRGRDFAGADLRGKDLSGANLAETNLSGAKLAGASLAGANLTSAVLVEADLTGADLTGADVSMADLTAAVLEGARASGCVLDKVSLAEAKLRKADLSGCKGEMVTLTGADLSGAKLAGSKLSIVDLQEALVEGSDFSGAELVRCFFFKAKGGAARFRDAKLDRTTFAEADLSGASFVGCKGEATVWLSAILDECDFGWAVLPRAAFDGAKIRGAKLFGADLRQARLYRAQLDRSSFERANLFEVDARKASTRGASFAKANLYGLTLEDG